MAQTFLLSRPTAGLDVAGHKITAGRPYALAPPP
jgi:hypothetical protein